MTKERFNEPELYLLKNWAKARLLEQSMEVVREKYAQVFDKVLDAVQKENEDLDSRAIHTAVYGGHVGIAKQTWPCRYAGWPSGLYVGSIALENLISEDEDVPEAYIRVETSKEVETDIHRAERKLRDSAKKIFSKRTLKGITVGVTKTKVFLSYNLPEPRQELLELLLSNNANRFIDCMVAHFEALARFNPVLDEIFASGKRRRKR